MPPKKGKGRGAAKKSAQSSKRKSKPKPKAAGTPQPQPQSQSSLRTTKRSSSQEEATMENASSSSSSMRADRIAGKKRPREKKDNDGEEEEEEASAPAGRAFAYVPVPVSVPALVPAVGMSSRSSSSGTTIPAYKELPLNDESDGGEAFFCDDPNTEGIGAADDELLFNQSRTNIAAPMFSQTITSSAPEDTEAQLAAVRREIDDTKNDFAVTNQKLNDAEEELEEASAYLKLVERARRSYSTPNAWNAAKNDSQEFEVLTYMDFEELKAKESYLLNERTIQQNKIIALRKERTALIKKETNLVKAQRKIIKKQKQPKEPGMHFSLHDSTLEGSVEGEFNFYAKIGEALKDHPTVVGIKNTVLRIAQSSCNFSGLPFIVVDAPSGSGKTQLPFALKAAGLNVVHLVLAEYNDGEEMQLIYRSFKHISFVFQTAVRKDCAKLTSETKSKPLHSSNAFSCDSLIENETSFQTVRFILEVLRQLGLWEEREEKPRYTIARLRGIVTALRKQSGGAAYMLPVFVLDEALAKDDVAKADLRLARNLLRAAGLVAMVMGTNSCAYNLVTAAEYTRRGKKSSRLFWCQLITRLPGLTENTLELIGANKALQRLTERGHNALVELVRTPIDTCLPYFVVLLSRVLEGLGDSFFDEHKETIYLMRELFARILSIVRHEKEQLDSLDALRGQIALQCSAYYLPIEDNQPKGNKFSILSKNSDLFVACHFARLKDENPKLFLSEGLLYANAPHHKRGEPPWMRCASFASPQDDPLLHLLFLGSHSFRCDVERKMHYFSPLICNLKKESAKHPDGHYQIPFGMSSYAALSHLKMIQAYSSNGRGDVCTENQNAQSREGDVLEALSAIAMGCSSRMEGFGGVSVLSFLRYLCAELLYTESKTFFHSRRLVWKTHENFAHGYGMDFQKYFGSKRVPFMSAPNTEWPQTLVSIPLGRFASLIRPANKDMIDLDVKEISGGTKDGVDISGECKNRDRDLTLPVLEGSLKRIPKTRRRRVHILFSAKVQKNYFTKKASTTWENFSSSEIPHYKSGVTNVAKLTLENNRLNIEMLSEEMEWIEWTRCRLLVVVIPLEHLWENSERLVDEA